MKTQKQQLLDYLAIHSSEAELLDLCRKVKDNRVAVEYFLKDTTSHQGEHSTQESVIETHERRIDDEVHDYLTGYAKHKVVHINDIIGGTGLERIYVWPSLQRLKNLGAVLDLGYDQYTRK